MSRSDSEKPPKRPEPTRSHPEPPGINGTRRAIINDRPARAPTWTEPAPRRRHIPDAFVLPKNQPPEDRDGFIAWLDKQWGGFISSELTRWGELAEESKRELRQDVLLIVSQHYEKEENKGQRGALTHVEKFLETTIFNVASTHVEKKRTRTRRIDDGAELDAAPDAALDPEGEAMVAEERERLARHRAHLTPEELEVLEARLDGATFDVIAAAVGRRRSTVDSQHARAVEKLRALELAFQRKRRR